MFQFAGFASRGYVFTTRYRNAVGFPIRKSSDQSLLATPRSLSQRATSFIASQCQGIHQTPFSYLFSQNRRTQRAARRQTRRTGNSTKTRYPGPGITPMDREGRPASNNKTYSRCSRTTGRKLRRQTVSRDPAPLRIARPAMPARSTWSQTDRRLIWWR